MEQYEIMVDDEGNYCGLIPSENGHVVQLADAQATIAALQARVKELEQWVQDQSTANLETMRHMDEMQSRAMEAESQLTQRTAECDALKLVNDTHMKTVMKLSHVVEQRTAELEALKIHCAIVEEHKVIAYKDAANLQAELERVRGELVEATHNVNVYQSLYSTSCMDRALLENELRDLREQNRVLREALQPFAERWEYFERAKHPSGGEWPEDLEYADDEPSAIYLGQLKAAKAALTPAGGGG